MAKKSRISGMISSETKERLKRLVRATGIKRGHILETALRHYLLRLLDLSPALVIPARIVVSRKSGRDLARLFRSPRKPTQDLIDLME